MEETPQERNRRIQTQGAKLAEKVLKRWYKVETQAAMWAATTIILGSLFKVSNRDPEVIKKELLANIDRLLKI